MDRKHDFEDDYPAKKPKFSNPKLNDDKILELEIIKILNDLDTTDFEKEISVRILLLNHIIKRKNNCFSNDLRKKTMHNYLHKSLIDFMTYFNGEINEQIIEDLGL